MSKTPDEFRQHLIIRASAGSGKTFALSNRFLKLLRQGAAPVSILAVTFTRKAAGEILERILLRLAHAAQSDAAARELAVHLDDPTLNMAAARHMLAALARDLHRLSIGTIDSFFHRVIRCFRHELGVPQAGLIVADDDPLARQLRAQAIEAMLADDTLTTLLDLMRRLHHDRAQRSVTDAIDGIVSQLYSTFHETPPQAWALLPEPAALSKPQLAEALQHLQAMEGELPKDKRATPAFFKDLQAAMALDWDGLVCGGLAGAVVKAMHSGEPARYYKAELSRRLTAAYQTLIEHARNDALSGAARRIAAMRELCERFDRHYRRLLDAHQVMLFSDLPRLLGRALGGLPENLPATDAESDDSGGGDSGGGGVEVDRIYYRLDAQVRHLMLDEFQDTSPLQWSVLRPLAEEIRAHAQDEKSGEQHGYDRTFFCVGDVKQAIYGWRGGCAEVFDQVEADLRLDPAARLSRSVSFRSSPVVLEAVNQVFGRIAALPPLEEVGDAAAAWARGFEPHRAHRRDLPGHVVLMSSMLPATDESATAAVDDDETDNSGDNSGGNSGGDSGGDSGGGPCTAWTPHESFVADHIASLHEQCPGCDIGVLVRRNRSVRPLIDLLRRQGIGASGEGGTPIDDDPAVEAVLAALTLTDHPAHTVAAFHVLHTPLAAIVGLASMREADAAAAGRAVRQRLLSDGYGSTLADWARQLQPACSGRNAVRLGQLVELAEKFDASGGGGSLRTRDFVGMVRQTAVHEPSAAAVRVMTVHKAKGLEFDIVVLPELGGRLGEVHRQAVWLHRDRPTAFPGGVFPVVKESLRQVLASRCPRLAQAHAQEVARRLQDDLSALYVAMTRAKQALHLIVEPAREGMSKGQPTGRPTSRGLHDLTPAAILRHALSDVDDALGEARVLWEHGDPRWMTEAGKSAKPQAWPTARDFVESDRTIRLARGTSPQAQRSWRTTTPSGLEAGGRVDAAALLAGQRQEAMRHGRAMHALLAAIAWLDGWDEAATLAAALAAEPGLGDQTWWDARTQALRAALAQPAVAALFRRPADGDGNVTLWRERSFALRTAEGELMQGVFDRVVIVRDAAGAITRVNLIDFKTDALAAPAPGGQTPSVERYRPQVQAYRHALATMLRIDPRTIHGRLAFVHSGQVVNV